MVEVREMAKRYPADVSVYGVRGVGGNVRDWTGTAGTGDRATRVVRGGAWGDSRIVTRCAYRALVVPMYVGDDVGFRVAGAARRTRA